MFMTMTTMDSDDEQSEAVGKTVLSRMREPSARKLCDVDIIIDDRRFPCHRAVLGAASDFFYNMFTGEWSERASSEVRLHSVDPVAFDNVLNFIYGGYLDARASKVLETHAAAKLLSLDTMDEQIRYRLISVLCLKNLVAINSHAHRFDDLDLQLACHKILIPNFDAVTDSLAVLELPFDDFLALLLPLARIISARQLLVTAIKWTQHCSEARKNSFACFCQLVCPSLISQDVMATICADLGVDLHVIQNASRGKHEKSNDKLAHFMVAESSRTCQNLAYSFADLMPSTLDRPRRTATITHNCWQDARPLTGSLNAHFRVIPKCTRHIQFDLVVCCLSHSRADVQPICSPWYSCGGDILWRLEVYLHGSSPFFHDYISLFLRCSDDARHGNFKCKASFSLFILEQDFGGHENVFEATKVFSNTEPCWGRARYAKRCDIFERQNTLRDAESEAVVLGVNITWETHEYDTEGSARACAG